PTTATCPCSRASPASPGCSATPSPPRSATSRALPRRASSPATPACARASTSRESATGAGRWRRTGPATFAGRSSRPPSTPPAPPTTASSTSAPRSVSARTAAPRWPRSRSPAACARRSGGCSPKTNRLLRQAPRRLWPHDGPRLRCATAARLAIRPSRPPRAQERDEQSLPRRLARARSVARARRHGALAAVPAGVAAVNPCASLRGQALRVTAAPPPGRRNGGPRHSSATPDHYLTRCPSSEREPVAAGRVRRRVAGVCDRLDHEHRHVVARSSGLELDHGSLDALGDLGRRAPRALGEQPGEPLGAEEGVAGARLDNAVGVEDD